MMQNEIERAGLHMKKSLKNGSFFVMCTLVFVFTITSLVFAGNDDIVEVFPDAPILESFEITRGLAKEVESTFDTSRTIVGTAEMDTFITIRTYRYDEDDEPIELHFYEITVGASGMFTQMIELNLGENIIEVTAALDGKETVQSSLIKRKKQEIKRELEQSAPIIELS